MGVSDVDCVRLDHLTDAERRAYTLAHNNTALETGFDGGLLDIELGELGGMDDFDFDMGDFGFDELGDAAAEIVEDEYDFDLPEKPVTEPGDVYRLGGHRLLCGDATAADDVIKLMNGEKTDMVFTDPPYGVNVKGGKTKSTIAGDLTMVAIPFSFELAVTVATRDKARFYFCGCENNLALYDKLFERFLRSMPRHIIWVKNGFVVSHVGYHKAYELIYYGFKPGGGGRGNWYGPRTQDNASDVWKISRDSSSDYLHPTQKPVEIPARAIENSSPPGALVYDPFGGSGSTLIACERLGRRCYMMDIDPVYCDVIVKRWEEFTNKKAEKISG